MTPLQAQMLREISLSDLTEVNGREPDTLQDIGWVWADTVITDAQDRGVFLSLQQAGLVVHSGGPAGDAGVTLTEAGFRAYKAL